jgi:hydrogenase nickel incorporation protein HypA/HybF
MHEMTLVAGILEIAEERAREAGAARINTVTVEIGRLAGVELPSLVFCFETARLGTLAAGAELVVREIPGRGRCPGCGDESVIDFYAALCPACGACLTVTGGRELRVVSLDVD